MPEPPATDATDTPPGAPERVRDVVIVGGGISGLAAAECADRWGLDFQLFEERLRLGGAIWTESVDGYQIDWGPNTVRTEGLAALQLADRYGLAEQRQLASPAARRRYIFRHGRMYPVGPRTLVFSSLLSGTARRTLVREFFRPQSSADREETIAEFFTRRYNREIAEVLVGSIVSGVYAGDIDRLSMRAVFPKLWAIEQRHRGFLRAALVRAIRPKRRRRDNPRLPRTLYSYRGGLAAIPAAMQAALGDRLAVDIRVVAIEASKRGNADTGGAARFRVRTRDRDGLESHVLTRSVVVALSAPSAARLLEGFDANVAAPLGGVAHAPLAVFGIGYRREDVPHALDGFGFLAPRSAGLTVLGALFTSSLFPDRAPDGHVLLTLFVGGATNPGALDLDDEALWPRLAEDLKATLGVTAKPRFVASRRYERAIPQYIVGHRERIAEVEAGIARHPGLAVCGNYLAGVSVADCVKRARSTMDDVRRYLADETLRVTDGA